MKLEEMIEFYAVGMTRDGCVIYEKEDYEEDSTLVRYNPKKNLVVALYKKIKVND